MLHPQQETLPRPELEQLQAERLQVTLNRVQRSVPFYRQQFAAANVDPDRIRTVADLRRLPFTTKEDLRAAYPYAMFAVPLRDIVRLHSTSGTTGSPVVVGYTRNDVRTWSELNARLLVAAGLTDHDIAHIAFTYGLFTGGLGFHYGAERVGASVIPASAIDNLVKQLTIMRDYKATALLCTPNYAVQLARALQELGWHPETLALRRGIFGAEPWSDSLRTRLQEELHLEAFDTYGLSEICGPGVAGECTAHDGLHINEDHFLVEVIDPATGDPLPDGSSGELVFTTLTKEGFPVIRYRTGDIAALLDGPCPCGRTLRRMTRVSGRTDDLIFFREQKIFPSQIEQVLLAVEGAPPLFQVVLDTLDGADTFEVHVAIPATLADSDEMRGLEEFRQRVARALQRELELAAKVVLVEPKSLVPADGGKMRRVRDNRPH